MWKISQPAKCGPWTLQFLRLPSESRMNAPLRVPANTRTLLMLRSLDAGIPADLLRRSIERPVNLWPRDDSPSKLQLRSEVKRRSAGLRVERYRVMLVRQRPFPVPLAIASRVTPPHFQ